MVEICGKVEISTKQDGRWQQRWVALHAGTEGQPAHLEHDNAHFVCVVVPALVIDLNRGKESERIHYEWLSGEAGGKRSLHFANLLVETDHIEAKRVHGVQIRLERRLCRRCSERQKNMS